MKNAIKYLITVFVAALSLSCTNEIYNVPTGESEEVVFELRSGNEVDTRAISDGTTVNKLIYAVFTDAGEVVIPRAIKNNASGMNTSEGLQVRVTLPTGRDYRAVFWLQNDMCEAYSLSDDMTVTVDYTGYNNDESRDAFFGATETFRVGTGTVSVLLKRPFAQMNVGAYPFDWEWVGEFYEFKATRSGVIIRDVPNKLDLIDGTVSGSVNAYYQPAMMPAETLYADVDEDGTDEEYSYLSMSYVLADAEATAHSVSCYFLNDNGEAVAYTDSRLESVSLQRNCTTNFIGQVLSDAGELNVQNYVSEGNTDTGSVYYNVTEDTVIENVIYNISDYNDIQFASENGQLFTLNNVTLTGSVRTIELGEYRGTAYVNYNNVLNNVKLENPSVSAVIECHDWYFSPAIIAYGNTTLNNCVMKGATTISSPVTDKNGEVHKVIPVDIGVRNESDAVFNGGEYGTVFAWTHSVVELNNVNIGTLYCGTCDSTDHSWMTIGEGTTIDKVICCEPRCPYGRLEYSTTMTIKSGAKVGSLQLVSTDVEFLIIEDGAVVGPITCDGVEYTYQELREAMGL